MIGWLRWKLHKRRTGHHCFRWRDLGRIYPDIRRVCATCEEEF